MTSHLRALLLVAGLALASSAQAQPAQPQATPPSAPQPVADPSSMFGKPETRFDLVFNGGTVAEYVAAVAAQPGVDGNVVLAPDARSVLVPAIRLTNVNVHVALRAVETLTDHSGRPLLSMRTIEDGGSSPLFVINAIPSPLAKGALPSLHSFRVAALLDPAQGGSMPAETLLGAIESLLSFQSGPGEPPRILLHKETSTLMMQAATDQLAAVENLITGLERDAQQRRELNRPNQSLIADLKAEQQAIREKREILQERVRLCERQIVETEEMIKQGIAPQSDREVTRERLRELEEQRIELDLREAHITSRLEEATAAAGPSQNEAFRVRRDRADATYQAASAIVKVMSPPAGVEYGDGTDQLIFRGSAAQIDAIRTWLQAQHLIAD